MLRCIECGTETDRFEPGWRTLLSFDPEQDSFDEAVSYCPDCSVREFDFPSRVSPRD
jgi:DNA-directed RNA polymerase subunit RPC12/RpoP